MPDYSFNIQTGAGGSGTVYIKISPYYCNNEEEYKTNPQLYFIYNAHTYYGWYMAAKAESANVYGVQAWGYRVAASLEAFRNSGQFWTYNNPTTGSQGGSTFYEGSGQSQNGYGSVTYSYSDRQQLPSGVLSYRDYRVDAMPLFEISTNIPIFETTAQMNEYLRTGAGITQAINYHIPVIEEGQDFIINNVWTHGTWYEDGHFGGPQGQFFRQVRGRMLEGGRLCFYRKDGIVDGKLQYGVMSMANYQNLEYSEDGGTTWISSTTFPYTFFYREHDNEVGTFDFGLTFYSQLPIWKDQNDATDYIQGNKDISEAENWDQIAPNYPPGSNIGDMRETETEFGEVYTRAMFSQLYLCDVGNLYEISNALFDYDVTTLSGIWDDIKKGLEMYGTDPMQVVQGLRYYPFDLSQYFTQTSDLNYIYFGAYQLQLQNGNVKKLTYPNGYIDLGTTKINRWYNDWRDFEPYTKLSVYLPYVGMFPLDAKKYYGKQVKIRYFIDLRTGACTACLIANKVLVDYFDGIIGTEMPITLTDYSSYAQSQLNIIMRNAGLGIAAEGVTGNIAEKGIKAAISYNANANAAQAAAQATPLTSSLAAQTQAQYSGLAIGGAAVGAGALLGTVAVGTGMKTAFDMMRTGTAAHTKTRPASSAMINQYLPQYPFFRTEIMEIDESAWLNDLYGRPSNKSDYLYNFSGYLECEDVSLICPIATDNERQEIIDLLKTGIYLTQP